jgi:hypothetical protein
MTISGPHVRALTAILAAVALLVLLPGLSLAAWAADGMPVGSGPGDQTPATAAGTSVCHDDAGGVIGAYRTGTAEIRINRLDGINGAGQWSGANGLLVTATAGGPPHVVKDGQGGAWVAWYDTRTAGTGTGLYIQHYDGLGTTTYSAAARRVSSGATPDPSGNNIDVDMASSGDLVLAWRGVNGIWVQRYLFDGSNGVYAKVSNDLNMSRIQVMADGDGSVVAWACARGSDQGIWANRVSAAGTLLWGSEGKQVMNRGPGTAPKQHTAAWQSNSLFVTWSYQPTGARLGLRDVYAQRLDSNGDWQWGSASLGKGVLIAPFESGISTSTQQDTEPQVVPDGAGGCFITWRDERDYYRPSGNGFNHNVDLYGQRLSSGGSVQWTANGKALESSSSTQKDARLVSDEAGGALLVYMSFFGSTRDILAKRINGSGDAMWSRTVCGSSGEQEAPLIAADGVGGFVAAWEDDRNGDIDTYAAHLGANGSRFVPALNLSAPNGGEYVLAETTQSITWTSNFGGNVALSYRREGFPSTTIDALTPNDGQYSWTVPNLTSAGARIILTELSGTLTDSSSTTFVICDRPFLPGTNRNSLAQARDLVVADLDDDGVLDLAAAVEGGLAVALGTNLGGSGDGTFGTPKNYAMATYGRGVVVDDFNGDRVLDLAVTQDTGVGLFLGQGTAGNSAGSFDDVSNHTTGTNVLGLARGDFNEDGISDLAVANGGSGSVSILLGNGSGGNGDGTFAAPVNYATAATPTRIVVADFDNDDIADLAVTCYNGGTFAVLLGQGSGAVGDGTFAAAANPWFTYQPRGLAAGDFDEDGNTDLALGNGNSAISICLGNGDGSFAAPSIIDGARGNYDLAVGDFTGDGITDLAAAAAADDQVSLYAGNGAGETGDGTFSFIASYNTGENPEAIVAADLDQDRRADLITANRGTGDAISFRGNMVDCQLATFAITVVSPTGGENWSVGSAQTVSWTADEGVVAVNIEVSRDGGQTWELLAENLTDSSWRWNVAAPASNSTRLRVYDPTVIQHSGANGSFFTISTGFSDLGAATGMADSGGGSGAAWADYDGDGDLDLYLARANGEPNRLMRNDGASGFVDVATSAGVADLATGRGVAWGDYDNDGFSDLFVSTLSPNPNRLYHNQGDGTFAEVGAALGIDTSSTGRTAAWADYDNDGDLDLYLAKSGANFLYRNDGSGFSEVAAAAGAADAGSSQGVQWADYDNDGDMDLYVSNTGANKLLANNGDGTFTDVTVTAGVAGSANSRGVAWGDYDNDSYLDLYVANVSGAANTLYHNQGDGTFADVTGTAGVDDANTGACPAWADYDNDSDLDLFLSVTNGPNRLYRNDGGGVFSDVSVSAGMDDLGVSIGASWGDYDSDGRLDLYVANFGQADRLYRNTTDEGNHWLHLDLIGSTSNRSAIGARVRLVAGGVLQIREVSGGSGMHSQDSQTVEFGLGAETVISSLEVIWPSGYITQAGGSIPVDQRFTLQEDGSPSGVDVAPRSPKAYALHAAVPNPFNPTTTLAFDLPAAARVRLRVFDVAGRLVRTLAEGTRLEAGTHRMLWDGRDERGAAVSAGVYLYHLDAGAFAQTRRAVMIK